MGLQQCPSVSLAMTPHTGLTSSSQLQVLTCMGQDMPLLEVSIYLKLGQKWERSLHTGEHTGGILFHQA